MASIRPAAKLGLEHEIGTLETRKMADLILLAENLLQSRCALHSIKTVLKDGSPSAFSSCEVLRTSSSATNWMFFSSVNSLTLLVDLPVQLW